MTAHAETHSIVPMETLRRAALILGASSAAAKTLAAYEALAIEGKTPVVISLDSSFVIFNDRPEEAAAGQIAIMREGGRLHVVPQELLEAPRP